MPSVVNLPWQILAVGLPLAGNGKASTAPHLQPKQKSVVPFLCGGGVRGINDTRCFFTTQNAVGRQFALANSCRRTPACGKRQSLYRPIPSTKAKIGCPFSMWWAYGAKPIKTSSKPASVPRSYSISNKRNHLVVSARKQTTTRSIHIQNTLFRFLVLLRAYCKTQ